MTRFSHLTLGIACELVIALAAFGLLALAVKVLGGAKVRRVRTR